MTFHSPNSDRRCLSRVSTSFFGSRTFCVDFLTSPCPLRVNIPLYNATVEAEITCVSPYTKPPVWLSLSSPPRYACSVNIRPMAAGVLFFCGCVNTEAAWQRGVVTLLVYASLFITIPPCTSTVCYFFYPFWWIIPPFRILGFFFFSLGPSYDTVQRRVPSRLSSKVHLFKKIKMLKTSLNASCSKLILKTGIHPSSKKRAYRYYFLSYNTGLIKWGWVMLFL